MIEERVKEVLTALGSGNPFGETVRLVAATKTRTPEEVSRAIAAGVTDVGENRVQEFLAKYDAAQGARRHFIGRLQLNKVKYLVGKADLIHSADRDELAEAIAQRARAKGLVQNVLIEINVGGEETKGGYPFEEGLSALGRLSRKEGLCVKGFMAMLPRSDDLSLLSALARNMRELFERGRERSETVEFLSMGMSGDWRLCVECGSNMIRLGSLLFGQRA